MNDFILRCSVVAAVGGLLFGFDTAIISGAVPYLQHYFKLNDSALGWAVSCILPGCAVGALLAGKCADRFGRRAVLRACAILFAVSGIGAGLANSLTVFVITRVIGGLGVGAAAMVSPMYIAEMAPAKQRGGMVAMYQLAIVTGILLAYLSDYWLSSIGDDAWRWMFATQAAPSLVFWLLLFVVPETPRWLARQENTQTSMPLRQLFQKPYRKLVLIGIVIAVLQQITGINAVLYYAPEIFTQTGIGQHDALFQTIFIGVINVAATFIAILFVDKLGRRTFFLIGSAVMCIALIAVASGKLVLIALLAYVATFGCTLGAVTWVYLSEIFPNNIRAGAMSVATVALWLADWLVSYTFPQMLAGMGMRWTLVVYAVCCAIAFIYFQRYARETRGKTLEQMETVFL